MENLLCDLYISIKSENVSNPKFINKLDNFTRNRILELSLVCTIVSAVFFAVGILGYLPDYAPQAITDLAVKMGDWKLWLFIVPPFFLLIGLYYLGDFLLKVRKFKKLLSTPSKANFVRTLDDIEYLAWKLRDSERDMVDAKKKEHNIKT